MLKPVEEREAWQATMASQERNLTDQLAAVVAFRQELPQWHADLLAREDTMHAKEQAWQQQVAELDVALGSLHELARLRQATKESMASTPPPAPAPPSDRALQALVGEERMSEALSMVASSSVPRAAQATIAAGIRANAGEHVATADPGRHPRQKQQTTPPRPPRARVFWNVCSWQPLGATNTASQQLPRES
jgi:hypothetical protein